MAKQRKQTDQRNDKTKTERVYRDLRRRIRELDLPPGLQLDKNRIADDYGVSRAPVSDAIARLAAEGLVDIFPQSGSFVAPVRLEELRESLLIRTGLEVEAARRVAITAGHDLLARLASNLEAQAGAVKRNDNARLDDLDEAFHIIIMSAVQAPVAERLLERTRAILDRPRFHTLPEGGRPLDTYLEHRRIVDAIGTGDAELAGAAMRIHLMMVAQAIEHHVAEERAQQQAGAKAAKKPN